jgi:uncharacterized protein
MNDQIEKPNRLANESSPYLLLHANNPVDWYPWGEEAFKKARDENKLVIISIGYSACHWCHVMEKESFSDIEVANIMNNHFVSIKVDREERPDIDKIYMDAAQMLSGKGGWPLNAFALPDGKPVFAATYFTKHQWIEILGKIQRLNENNKEKLVHQANEITKGILLSNSFFFNSSGIPDFKIGILHQLYQNLIKSIDFENGGLNAVPKFPMPVVFDYLLHYFHLTNETKALEAVTITLDKMASGGIFDQIGGGFARYSTDKYWRIPHFEKMLYDNAQLVSLYAEVYKITKYYVYSQVIENTLEFISREMTSPEAGFYSAIDADSEGEEGKYYTWSFDEICEILQEDKDLFIDYYSLKKSGNWEFGKNVLFKTNSDDTFFPGIDVKGRIHNCNRKLLHYRNEKRIRPLTDTKIITSWNAMMLKGYIEAYSALGKEEYLDIALKNANFIIRKLLTSEGKLYRNYKEGKIYNNAMLEDYANTIQAFISLYQVTFDEGWLDHACRMMEYSTKHFYDSKSGLFYFTSDWDEELITRQFEVPDQAVPSSNSIMANNLYLLGTLFDNSDYLYKAGKMLGSIQENLLSKGIYFANWAKLYILFISNPYEIALVGENCMEINKKLLSQFLPDVILTGGKEEGKLPLLKHKLVNGQTSIYVCRNKTCSLPVTDLNEALHLLKLG